MAALDLIVISSNCSAYPFIAMTSTLAGTFSVAPFSESVNLSSPTVMFFAPEFNALFTTLELLALILRYSAFSKALFPSDVIPSLSSHLFKSGHPSNALSPIFDTRDTISHKLVQSLKPLSGISSINLDNFTPVIFLFPRKAFSSIPVTFMTVGFPTRLLISV